MTGQWATLTVHGKPIPKARPRFANGHVHSSKRSEQYEAEVGWMGRKAMKGRRPTAARVAVTIDLYGPDTSPVQDVDNIAKAILDGLNGIVWVDDQQVDDLHVRRHLGTPDPRAVVVVTEIAAPAVSAPPATPRPRARLR